MPIPTIPAEVLLINVEYLKQITNINGAVDPNILTPCITLAQDRWVQPYLGDDLMAKIKSDISAASITGVYSTLYLNYIMKCVAWATLVECLPDLVYKMDNGTLVQRTSEDASPVSDATAKDLVNRAQGRLQYYQKRLVDYLCANSASFPEYSSNQFPERCPRTDVYGQFNYAISSGNSAMSRNTGPKRYNQWP